MKCVDRKELAKFLQGDMEPERLVAVDEHVSACATCRAALTALPARGRAIASFAADLMGVSDCPEYGELSALVEDALHPAAKRPLDAHLNICEVCSRNVDHMRALRSQAALRDTVQVQPGTVWRRPLWQRRAFQRALATVAVVGAIAVAAVTFREPPKAPVEKPVVTVKAPAPEPAHPKPEPAVTPAPPKKPVVAIKPEQSPKPVAPKPSPLLNDGKYRLVKVNGKYAMTRIDGKSIRTPLEARVAALIAEKIRTGKIKPGEPTRVALNTIRLRSDEGYDPPPTAPNQISPVGVVVKSDHPTFTWSKVDLAHSYRLLVTDTRGSLVFEGTTDKTRLKLDQPLERGQVYIWRVGVRFSEGDTWANSRAAGLRPISTQDLSIIRDVEQALPGSHLALAAVYESVGLYDDAAERYRAVRRANPGSQLARRLVVQ